MDATRMLKQQKNREGEKSNQQDEQEEVVQFTGRSGEKRSGEYHDRVHSWKSLSWQSNDAEVDLLEQVASFLRLRKNRVYGQITLYMRGSKGPCTSCKKLITIFRQAFPNVKVICEYQQVSAQERDVASKAPGQDLLTYGYTDAVRLFPGEKQSNKESYCKVFPALACGIEVPQGVKGFSMETLEGFFTRYAEKYTLNPAFTQQFVRSLPRTVLEQNQFQSVIDWLNNRLAYEEQVALSEDELTNLFSLDSPSSGYDVVVYGLLCLSRVAPLPGWQKKGSSQRQVDTPTSEPDEEEEKFEEEDFFEEEEEKFEEEHNADTQEMTSNDNGPSPTRKEKKKGTAGKKKKRTAPLVEGSKKLRQRITRTLPGIGVIINVSGEEMNCLIRALLVAAGHKDDEVTVDLIRDELVRQKVSKTGTMLNLVSTAGAILISYLEFLKIIDADRAIVVYTPNESGAIIQHKVYAGKKGKDPIMLWLSDEHFQAIVPEKKS